jgi:hypothetical protein
MPTRRDDLDGHFVVHYSLSLDGDEPTFEYRDRDRWRERHRSRARSQRAEARAWS